MLRATSYAPTFNEAVGTTEPYRGTDHTVAVMIQLAKGLVDPRAMVQNALQGERSIRFRRHTEQIINNLRPKDYTSEIIAISRWWGNAGRYTRDPLHVELIRSPDRLLDDALAGRLLVDCFPEGTLVLRDDYTFLPIEHARAGDKIWGYDRWSTITAHSDKGDLSVDAIRLNNGSWLRLTPDHKVYVKHCAKHPEGVRPSGKAGLKPCWCREREIKRISVADLREGHVLLVPDRIPFGIGEMDPDMAYVDGLYLSDGWCQQSRFNISGKDGHPKEGQKREVEAICERLGISTTWHHKSIEVHGAEWAGRMAAMGRHATQKRALSINLNEGAAAALLRGIMADSGANTCGATRTFTTTSRHLMLQARVLHRMFGVSCGYSFIEDHGGLGENPIWRLSTRVRERSDGAAPKVLRVKEIVRNAGTARCYDIATDDHYVYLPEQDVTVSNCDDLATAIATSCMAIGARAQFVTVGFKPRRMGEPKVHTHVFCRAQDPKSKVWWVLDPVAGRKTADMLRRVRQYTIFEVD